MSAKQEYTVTDTLSLKIDRALRKKIERLAAREERSVSGQVRHMLRQAAADSPAAQVDPGDIYERTKALVAAGEI